MNWLFCHKFIARLSSINWTIYNRVDWAACRFMIYGVLTGSQRPPTRFKPLKRKQTKRFSSRFVSANSSWKEFLRISISETIKQQQQQRRSFHRFGGKWKSISESVILFYDIDTPASLFSQFSLERIRTLGLERRNIHANSHPIQTAIKTFSKSFFVFRSI